jgi:hypothetical protein
MHANCTDFRLHSASKGFSLSHGAAVLNIILGNIVSVQNPKSFPMPDLPPSSGGTEEGKK